MPINRLLQKHAFGPDEMKVFTGVSVDKGLLVDPSRRE
jgi:hypothetical protein